MKNIFLILSVLLLFFIQACEKEEPVISPELEKSTGANTIFKQQLKTEIESEKETVNMPDGFIHEITGPTVITQPGIYRVVNDFNVTSGDGIVINSDWVLLWIGHHTITGPGNKVGRAVVVDGAENVLVFGGKLKTFGIGVSIENSSKTGVKSVKVLGGDEFADPPAVPPQIGVLLLNSNWNVIAGNEARLINLGIFVRGPESHHNKILLNKVKGGVNGLLGICYNPAPDGGPGGPTSDDVFLNDIRRFGTGIQTAAEAANNKFSFNKIYYFNLPWEDLNGTNIFFRNKTVQITP